MQTLAACRQLLGVKTSSIVGLQTLFGMAVDDNQHAFLGQGYSSLLAYRLVAVLTGRGGSVLVGETQLGHSSDTLVALHFVVVSWQVALAHRQGWPGKALIPQPGFGGTPRY